MIRAMKSGDGFLLIADKSKETYAIKEKIKELDGRWDGMHWILTQKALDILNIPRWYEVKVAPHCCNSKESISYAYQKDIDRGMVRLGCSRCDISDRCGQDVRIIEVLED